MVFCGAGGLKTSTLKKPQQSILGALLRAHDSMKRGVWSLRASVVREGRETYLYKSDFVRLDTRRLNNTSVIHRQSKRKKRKRRGKKCRTRQHKIDSWISGLPE